MVASDRMLHWIGHDPGDAASDADEGFVWLDDHATGGNGSLWVVARGHGPDGAPPIAVGLTVHTFHDVYVDALQDGADPFGALDRAASEAGMRLQAAVATYPDLRGMACSLAAVAVRDGQAWPVHIGASRIYLWSRDRIERLTRDHVSEDYAVHDEAAAGRLRRDDIVDRAIGHRGARLDRVSDHPVPVTDHALLLCTDGLWRATSDEILQQALLRLPPHGAYDALVDLARRQWFEDDLTMAIVRHGPPDAEHLTTGDEFVRWAQGESVHRDGGNATLVIQTPMRGADDTPETRIFPARLPNLDAAFRASPAPPVRETDPTHTVALTPAPPVASAPPAAAARSASGTQLLSADAIAAAPASASRTQAFSPQDLEKLRAGSGSPSVIVSDEAALAESTGAGTQIFAPADLAPARAAAESPHVRKPPARRGGGATLLAPAHPSGPGPVHERAKRPAPAPTTSDPFQERWDGRSGSEDEAWLDDSGLQHVLTPGRKLMRTLLWLGIALLSAGGGFAATLWFINR